MNFTIQVGSAYKEVEATIGNSDLKAIKAIELSNETVMRGMETAALLVIGTIAVSVCLAVLGNKEVANTTFNAIGLIAFAKFTDGVFAAVLLSGFKAGIEKRDSVK